MWQTADDRSLSFQDAPSACEEVVDGKDKRSRFPSSWIHAFSRHKDRTLEAFRTMFYNLGAFIFDHAIWFIFCSGFFALVCGIGFLFIHFETRADLLYALPASRARSDLAKQTTLFGKPPRVNMVFVVSADNSTVLTPKILKKLKGLDDFIKKDLRSEPKAVRAKNPEEGARSFVYEDVCYRMHLQDVNFTAVRGSSAAEEGEEEQPTGCYSMSPLDLYRNERQFGTPLATRQWPYIPNIAENKIVKADLTLTDPSIVKLSSGTTRLYNATGFLLLYHTQSDSSQALAQSLEWEEALIKFINDDIKPHAADADLFGLQTDLSHRRASKFNDLDWQEFKVFVNAQRSWQDELGRSTSMDARLMRDYLMAYCIIATYMVVFNRTNNLVRSKSICGFLGSLSALIGFVMGGGICYWLGLRHTPTMHASPFLVLAIGLDNTFVVLNFYTLAFTYVKQPRERCRMALSDSGISLTITTFTSIISFLVGAAGPYLAVRNFCLVTAMGLLGGFIANIVFFFPFLCLESIAEAEGRILFLPVPLWIYDKIPDRYLTPDTAVWLKEQKGVDSTATTLTHTQQSTEASTGDQLTAKPPLGRDPFANTLTGSDIDAPARHSFRCTAPAISCEQNPSSRIHKFWRDRDTHRRRDCELQRSNRPFHMDTTSQSSLSQEGRITSGSMPTVADSQENVTLHQRRRIEGLKKDQQNYLSENLLIGRSLFEVASIQWRFRKRRIQLAKEMKRQNIPIPSEIVLEHSEIDPADMPLLTNTNFSLVEAKTSKIPPTLLTPLYKTSDMVVKMSEEPDGNNGKWSRGFFLKTLGPIWSRTWLQIVLMSILMFYLGISLYGAIKHLSAGLDLENLTPPDSYLREAFALSHDKFPIFPYETNIVFSAPDISKLENPRISHDKKMGIVKTFSSDNYGTRRASDLKPLSVDDVAAHAGSGDGFAEQMQPWKRTLGEVPWWEPTTLETLMVVDKSVRAMETTQDVLNGLLLFFTDNAHRILMQNTTSSQRRKLFHQHLYKWLSTGVVGRHVRNQFLFGDPLKSDPEGLPRLLGFKLTVFNYNFLNSYAQSQYMINIRRVSDALSMDWSTLVSPRRHKRQGDADMTMSGMAIDDAPYPNYKSISDKLDPPVHVDGDLGSWFSVKPFMETFLFFESDITILRATIINMSTAFIAIIIASSLLMRGVASAVLVSLMICAVDLGIFGAMGFWGIHLNILSMILLVLSIGFSVDYTVHVVHTFAHAVGTTRKDRMVETLILMCNPVTHGAISTTLGILPIWFRKEFIMETFFQMTILVVGFGFLNGVIFLPVILSLRGPKIASTKTKSLALQEAIEEVVRPLMLDTYKSLTIAKRPPSSNISDHHPRVITTQAADPKTSPNARLAATSVV